MYRKKCLVILFVAAAATMVSGVVPTMPFPSRAVAVSSAPHRVQHPLPANAATVLPVAVNGGQRPSDIPNWLAHRHLMLALAASKTASGNDLKRRDVLMKRLALSSADSAALLAGIAGTREQLDEVHRLRIAASTNPNQPSAVLDSLRDQENALADGAATRIMQQLSAAGREKLQQFVDESIKPNVTIYGVAPRNP